MSSKGDGWCRADADGLPLPAVDEPAWTDADMIMPGSSSWLPSALPLLLEMPPCWERHGRSRPAIEAASGLTTAAARGAGGRLLLLGGSRL